MIVYSLPCFCNEYVGDDSKTRIYDATTSAAEYDATTSAAEYDAISEYDTVTMWIVPGTLEN